MTSWLFACRRYPICNAQSRLVSIRHWRGTRIARLFLHVVASGSSRVLPSARADSLCETRLVQWGDARCGVEEKRLCETADDIRSQYHRRFLSGFRCQGEFSSCIISNLIFSLSLKLSEFLYENEPDFVAHINALSRFFVDLSLFDSIASDWRVAQNGIVDEYRLQVFLPFFISRSMH